MHNSEKINIIIMELNRLYGEAKCSLNFGDALQLLVATQLSAQCTDKRVNIVTKSLFQKYKTVYDYANADFDKFSQDIKSTGFYNNKARNIIACCKMLIEKFGGEVPKNIDDMVSLPGVGRKTANLVLGEIYGFPGIVVDTHAKRLAKRIGLTKSDDPNKIEIDLMKIVPKDKWSILSHQFVYHGRKICFARNPLCEICKIKNTCDYFENKSR